MRSHRFYVDLTLEADTIITLPKAASHHCINVLRYRPGDTLILFNGDGNDYPGAIEVISGKTATVKLTSGHPLKNESALKIQLYQSMAKGDKMDLIIQKCVELGVSEITPLISERSNVKLEPKRLEKKLSHWRGVSISASEQSGRAVIVPVNPPINISELTAQSDRQYLYLDPYSEKRLVDHTIEKNICLVIGPEGGFSDRDITQLTKLNAAGASIGPRILRTETAGLASIAILQSQFGDL